MQSFSIDFYLKPKVRESYGAHDTNGKISMYVFFITIIETNITITEILWTLLLVFEKV